MFFNYKVLTKDKKEIEGRVDANNRTNAISLLQSKGYLILSLDVEADKSILDIQLFQSVKTRDLVIFSRQIATLFEAQVPALKSFNLVSENVDNRYFKQILQDITTKIEKGASIGAAFKAYENVFGEFFTNIVAVGDQSGTLSRSFSYLADYVERNSELTSKIRKALTYPIFVIVVFIGVMGIMFVTIIPQISVILVQSGQELPQITQIVLSISDFIRGNLIIILVVLIGSVVGALFYAGTEEGRDTFGRLVLSIPVIGKIFRQFYLIRFTDNMGVLLKSGVPIVVSLEIVERVMVNTVYKKAVGNIAKGVRQGVSISKSISNEPIIGKNISSLIKVGEETGQVDKMLIVVSRYYQQQLENSIATAIDLIQPTVIIVLGISVGVLIGSVILPIYSLSTSI